MQIVMIPGFWLDGDSWSAVADPLRASGHTVHTPTLPGLDSPEADRSHIGLRDHVDAVIALVDELTAADERVVLVGHSGGGAIAYAVADARPDRIARVVYVDSGPLGHGSCINDELPIVDGEIPLPAWEIFENEDLVDLTDELREQFRVRALPQPAKVATDAQQLGDPARFAVPATIVCCEFSSDQLQSWVAGGAPFVAELSALSDVDYVDLPTGHWPQFTRPAELAEVVLAAVGRTTA